MEELEDNEESSTPVQTCGSTNEKTTSIEKSVPTGGEDPATDDVGGCDIIGTSAQEVNTSSQVDASGNDSTSSCKVHVKNGSDFHGESVSCPTPADTIDTVSDSPDNTSKHNLDHNNTQDSSPQDIAEDDNQANDKLKSEQTNPGCSDNSHSNEPPFPSSKIVSSLTSSPPNLQQEIEQAESVDGCANLTVSTEDHVSLDTDTHLNTLRASIKSDESQHIKSIAEENKPFSLEDRNLEQFSEILLDSDVDSDEESQPVITSKKITKHVRFADEVTSAEGSTGIDTSSPRPQPQLPFGLSSDLESPHPKSPVSPTSPSLTQPTPSMPHTTEELINGVEYSAQYLGSTPIMLCGSSAIRHARMHQAQQAVKLIKDPENDARPHVDIKVKISTQAVKICDAKLDVELMEHPLHTISYVADIDGVLVMMAYVGPLLPPSNSSEGSETTGITPKLTCHVLDTDDARLVAMVIGQAFGAAYKQFLKSLGVSEESLEEAEYAHILNAQTVPQLEVNSLADRNKMKTITMAKHKGEMMGIMIIESGPGSAIPSYVIAHMSKTGAAAKSGLLNVGDHIISLDGVSLVGISRKSCTDLIKKCRHQNVVKMVVGSCSPVVDVTIVRPDLKYQLGFTVQDGMIRSLVRGSIAHHSGIRIGHNIIEVNGTSTVGMKHDDIVHLLSSTVGDLHIRTMPNVMYRLLTGQIVPEYH